MKTAIAEPWPKSFTPPKEVRHIASASTLASSAAFLSPAMALVVTRLMDRGRITAGRIHPLVLLSALNTYRRGTDRPISMLYGLWPPIAGKVDFDAATLHDVRSVSKSVVGLLFGIALGDGPDSAWAVGSAAVTRSKLQALVEHPCSSITSAAPPRAFRSESATPGRATGRTRTLPPPWSKGSIALGPITASVATRAGSSG